MFLEPLLCHRLIEQVNVETLGESFGQPHQGGRVKEDPNIIDFIKNTHTLLLINGVCRDVKGNCWGSNSNAAKFAPSR